jgi:uncharacterized integral membrane protein (TIGR00698 family)
MTASVASPLETIRNRTSEVAPGILIAFTIAAAATFISEHYGAPVMLFALLIGMAFHFLSVEGRCAAGIKFTASRLLRIGVALLGVKVTFAQVTSLGATPLVLAPALIAATIAAGVAASRLFGRSLRFGLLTGGAVAICGASAAMAIAAVLPKREGDEGDTLFTVVAVTSLSTVAMVIYPAIFAALGFDDRRIGVLIGATIHDVAQVVGAGYAVSDEAGDVATYMKLLRVACLPLVVIALALAARARSDPATGRSEFPWFAVAFGALLAINSLGVIPEPLRASLEAASRWLLVAAIAALGMKTSLKAMADLGPRHIGVVVAETLALALLAIAALSFAPL